MLLQSHSNTEKVGWKNWILGILSWFLTWSETCVRFRLGESGGVEAYGGKTPKASIVNTFSLRSAFLLRTRL